MGGIFGIWQWVIVLAIVLLLFGGRGKISGLMGDFGKGLKSFKKALKDDDPKDGTKDESLSSIEDKPTLKTDAKVEEKDKMS